MCVAAINLMTNSTVDNGRSSSIQSQEQGSDPFARTSQQQPFQTDAPDSAYTNGHIPPHATNGISDDSESRTVPPEAPLPGCQGSFGIRQRGEGWGPDRQGSHGRYAHALLCLCFSHKQHNQNACLSNQSIVSTAEQGA